MPKYRVMLQRTDYFTIEVEAVDEDEAIEQAASKAPNLCAGCSGWGTGINGFVESDPWQPLEDLYGADYNPDVHGCTIQEV